jgi:hypothetical protein
MKFLSGDKPKTVDWFEKSFKAIIVYESSHVADVDVFFEKLFSGNKLNGSGTVPGKRECDL